MENEFFCKYQDKDSQGIYCCAHIHEGRVNSCIFSTKEEVNDIICIDYEEI